MPGDMFLTQETKQTHKKGIELIPSNIPAKNTTHQSDTLPSHITGSGHEASGRLQNRPVHLVLSEIPGKPNNLVQHSIDPKPLGQVTQVMVDEQELQAEQVVLKSLPDNPASAVAANKTFRDFFLRTNIFQFHAKNSAASCHKMIGDLVQTHRDPVIFKEALETELNTGKWRFLAVDLKLNTFSVAHKTAILDVFFHLDDSRYKTIEIKGIKKIVGLNLNSHPHSYEHLELKNDELKLQKMADYVLDNTLLARKLTSLSMEISGHFPGKVERSRLFDFYGIHKMKKIELILHKLPGRNICNRFFESYLTGVDELKIKYLSNFSFDGYCERDHSWLENFYVFNNFATNCKNIILDFSILDLKIDCQIIEHATSSFLPIDGLEKLKFIGVVDDTANESIQTAIETAGKKNVILEIDRCFKNDDAK